MAETISLVSLFLTFKRRYRQTLCCFRLVVKRRLLGEFIIKEFSKYKDFHHHAKKHMQSEWHRDSVSQSTDFINIMSIKEKNVMDQ